MTYLKRSKRPGRGRATTAFVVGGLVFVFALTYLFPSFFPSVFFPVGSLFWRAEQSTVGFFVSMGKIVQSKYSLVEENKRLTEELAARDRAALMLDDVRTENETFKSMLGRTGKGNYVLGVILVRPPVSLYDTLVIDVGTKDGVAAGDKVYAEGDVLVGDIAEAYGSQSKVALYSVPGRKTPILVGTSTVATDATGRGGGNFIFTLPAQTKLAEGAVITMPSIRNHIFGVVQRIMVDSTDSVQTVLFRSPANVNQLRFVEVDRTLR
ncbi:MAG TPA: rod shape-determining protein MreC [Candidatus Paceibacterota bacterium]|jgi:cell shape-determining protein MreC|nr:rod shape-determining protein MreC [Candidatus Paceibacterota bacterium]